MEKYGRARQATDHSIIQHMPFVCWINKITDTRSEHVICIALFHCNNGYANVHLLPILLNIVLCILVGWFPYFRGTAVSVFRVE